MCVSLQLKLCSFEIVTMVLSKIWLHSLQYLSKSRIVLWLRKLKLTPYPLQVLQAMDQDRICKEYWKSRPLALIPQGSAPGDNLKPPKPEVDNEARKRHLLPTGADAILGGLFKKAKSEELQALHSLLNNNPSPSDQGSVARLLSDEIHRRGR